MLTIEKYLNYIFEIIRIDAQMEELKRMELLFAPNKYWAERKEMLYLKKDRILRILDKEHKPVEIAPFEQYIEIELQYQG